MITETWIADQNDKDLAQDLSLGAGLGMLSRGRHKNNRGVAHGGVAVVWKEGEVNMRKIKMNVRNDDDFEVLTVAGSMTGHSRKLVVVACYLPPNYCKKKGQAALEYIAEVIVEVKKKYKDPYLFIAGDFNQWKIEEPLQDFMDIREVEVGDTRGSRCIDRIFSNLGRSVTESGTLAPLETDEDEVRKSDHRVAFCRLRVPRLQSFTWETYSYLSLIHI